MKIQDSQRDKNTEAGYAAAVWRNFRSNRPAKVGFFVLFLMLAVLVIWKIISPYTPSGQDVAMQNQASSFTHFFGTDRFGRDIFTRVCEGAGISLFVGAASAAMCTVTGILYGGAAGMKGGKTDLILMRFADMTAAVPSLLYTILIMLVLGQTVSSVFIGICVSGWIDTARIVRQETLRLRSQEFVMAARLYGSGGLRIFFVHLLRNMAGPVLVNMVFLVPQGIFMESFLSFVGVGIAAPAASLGTMIQEARSQLQVYPMQMIYPMIILCGLIFAWNLVGHGLQEAAGKR